MVLKKTTKEMKEILNYSGKPEIIHADNLVVFGGDLYGYNIK